MFNYCIIAVYVYIFLYFISAGNTIETVTVVLPEYVPATCLLNLPTVRRNY